jgi:hypothetical protein
VVRKLSCLVRCHRLKYRVSLRVAILIWLACATRIAAAERTIVVDVDAELPFTADDLERALRVRLDPDGVPVRLEVQGRGGTAILVTSRGTRTIELGERSGDDAARLVAMMAEDLLLVDLAHAPVLTPVAPVLPAVVARGGAPSLTELDIALAGTATVWSGMLAGATVDVAWARRAWLAGIELGGGELLGGGLALRAGTLGVAGGVRLGMVDVRIVGKLAAIDVHEGVGDVTVVPGGAGSARLRLPVAAGHVVVAVGLDAFATRTVYQTMAGQTVATPWFAPWLATGFEVRL